MRWLALRGVEGKLKLAQPMSCSQVRRNVKFDIAKARAARLAYQAHVRELRTLHDFEVAEGNNAWHRAVREAQKAYPGTDDWLLSCSSSEGGHGRWVRYGGGSYYEGYRGVGGWLQFMPGTFDRMFAAARAEVLAKGYIIAPTAKSWLSPLGQALAGAWGSRHSRQEWAGSGCR